MATALRMFKNLLGTNSFDIFLADKGESLHSVFFFNAVVLLDRGP